MQLINRFIFISLLKHALKVSSLLMRTQESQGCQKMRQHPLNSNFEVWWANMDPKLTEILKNGKKIEFLDNFYFNFDSFFEVSSNLGQL